MWVHEHGVGPCMWGRVHAHEGGWGGCMHAHGGGSMHMHVGEECMHMREGGEGACMHMGERIHARCEPLPRPTRQRVHWMCMHMRGACMCSVCEPLPHPTRQRVLPSRHRHVRMYVCTYACMHVCRYVPSASASESTSSAPLVKKSTATVVAEYMDRLCGVNRRTRSLVISSSGYTRIRILPYSLDHPPS